MLDGVEEGGQEGAGFCNAGPVEEARGVLKELNVYAYVCGVEQNAV